jgi:hypothetical protein
MSINYNYEIVSVNEQARCMEIAYTAPNHPTQHIGARLPYEGETLETVVRIYSPVNYWEEIQKSVSIPTVGTSGNIPAADEAAAAAAALASQSASQPTGVV